MRSVAKKINFSAFILTLTLVWFIQTNTAQATVAVSDSVVRNNTGQIVNLNRTMDFYLRELYLKEYQLDPRANAVKTQAANAYYNQVRGWIAAGNGGDPLFWDSLEGQLQEIEATTTMAVIDEIAASGNVCNAFQDQIIVQLKESYIEDNARNAADKISCDFDEDDTTSLASGEFTVQNFYKATLRNDSPIGQYQEAKFLVEQETEEQLELARENFRVGQGYREQYEAGQNLLVCASGNAGGGEQNGVRNRCRLASPAYAAALRSGAIPNLEVAMIMDADELGETQSDPFRQLAQQTAVTGITGRANNPLPPLNPPPDDANNPPTDPPPPDDEPEEPVECNGIIPETPTTECNLRFVAEVIQNAAASPTGGSNVVRDPLTQTLLRFQTQLDTLTMLDETDERHENAQNAFASLSCYDLTYPSELQQAATNAILAASGTIVAIESLHGLFNDFDEAVALGTTTAPVSEDLQELRSENPWIASPAQVDAEQIAFTELRNGPVTSFNQLHDEQVRVCQQIGL